MSSSGDGGVSLPGGFASGAGTGQGSSGAAGSGPVVCAARGSGSGSGINTVAPLSSGPAFNPGLWNNPPIIDSTNCYAYAANDPYGHPSGKPQPGEHCQHPYADVSCAAVSAAAQCDGMVPASASGGGLGHGSSSGSGGTCHGSSSGSGSGGGGTCHGSSSGSGSGSGGTCHGSSSGSGSGGGSFPPSQPGYYLVALVMAPGVDYHWYRQDSNGMWSHKPGNTASTNIDASGLPITNPENANRDYSGSGGPNYSQFCGYFYVPASGVRTGPP